MEKTRNVSFCRSCRTSRMDSDIYCYYCGNKLVRIEGAAKRCENCGYEDPGYTANSFKYCPACGAAWPKQDTEDILKRVR